jgi:mono/diheme cytochrome c family protein
MSGWAFSDPDFRTEVTIALIALIAGVAIVVVGLAWRRIRWFALVAGAVIVAAAMPHLDLLFVAAYPTSFFTSPTEFAATAIVHGAQVFAANCVTCHGAEGRGDGPAAKSLLLPPADLTAAHFLAHSDGELYWYISHGFTADDGTNVMPGFDKVLSSEAMWDVIDYLHAHHGGYALRHAGSWPQPLQVPQFDVECANGQMKDLEDLRGRGLRIIAASTDEQPEASLPSDLNVATILVLRNVAAKRATGTCIASEPQVWTALSAIVGVSPDALAGTEVLADQNGWLRAAWHPGDADDWNDPQVLAARMRDILAHPLTIVPSSGHVHSR